MVEKKGLDGVYGLDGYMTFEQAKAEAEVFTRLMEALRPKLLPDDSMPIFFGTGGKGFGNVEQFKKMWAKHSKDSVIFVDSKKKESEELLDKHYLFPSHKQMSDAYWDSVAIEWAKKGKDEDIL